MATFPDWQSAVNSINEIMKARTEAQKLLADQCGLKVGASEPELLVAAKLKAAFAEELCIVERLEPDSPAHKYIEYLVESAGLKRVPKIESRSLADAWIYLLQLKIRKKALEKLKIKEGDIVKTTRFDAKAEVSSISSEGRVYFKGGRGFRAWPDTITILERKSRNAESNLRRKVRSEAAKRRETTTWSLAKSRDLGPYELKMTAAVPIDLALGRFESELAQAVDERRMQNILEKYPNILGSLLARTPRYVIPRPSLGGSYVPDFLLMDVDSSGAHWTFVELESPTAKIYINGGKEFSKNARTGISQVKEWRRWVARNRDLARRPKSEGGLGFSDIDNDALGLVIVGRESGHMEEGNPIRRQLKDENRIELRSYDGILAQVRNCLEFNGPPLYNDYLLRKML